MPSNVPLKDPASFRLIGRDDAVTKLDSAAKTNGTARFTLDIREPGVEIETMLAGGSFGRRAQQTTHFAAELAEAAKAIGPGRP